MKPNPFIKTTLLLSILSLFCFSVTAKSIEPSLKETLTSLISQHKGDVVYIDFWASWCVPCRKSFPWMNAMQKKYAANGFTVISINVDAEKQLAEQFLIETPASFPVVFDPNGILAKEFNVKGMPSSYLIDRNGQLVKTHTGFFTNKKTEYEKEINQLVSPNGAIATEK